MVAEGDNQEQTPTDEEHISLPLAFGNPLCATTRP
jgi:hypothetical protein